MTARHDPTHPARPYRQCTCFLVRRLARTLTRYYDRQLADHGITVGQFSLLRSVSRQNKALGVLAGELGLDRTTLNRNLKPLIAAGLIASHLDAGDARARLIGITAQGLAVMRAAREDWRQAQLDLEALVGNTDVAHLHLLLEDTRERVEQAFFSTEEATA